MKRSDHVQSLISKLNNYPAYSLSEMEKRVPESAGQKVLAFIVLAVVLTVIGGAIGALFALGF